MCLCRRAAIGSGAALAVHMALSQRARLQAGAMLRGSVLAALAGTATVCACLAYVSPARQNDDEHDGSSSQPQAILAAPEEQATNSRRRWYGESRNEAAPDAGRTDESEAQGSRLRTYRAGLQRWMTRLAPSAQRLVSLATAGGLLFCNNRRVNRCVVLFVRFGRENVAAVRVWRRSMFSLTLLILYSANLVCSLVRTLHMVAR